MGLPFAPSKTPWAPRSEFSVTCSNGGETIKIKWIPVKENTIGAGQIASVQDSFYYSKEDRYAHCKSRRWRALLCSLSSSFESLGNHSKCIRAYNSIYCNQFEYSAEYSDSAHWLPICDYQWPDGDHAESVNLVSLGLKKTCFSEVGTVYFKLKM